MKISGVYKIINKVNGKFYIGSSVNIKMRWYRHTTDLLRNVHKNIHLQRAWNKYGRNNFIFEIIEEISKEKLIEIEQKYLNKNFGNPDCYNLVNTSINLHGKNNPFYGKRHTPKTKLNLSKSKKEFYSKNVHPWIGRKHLQITIEKIRKTKIRQITGQNHPWYDFTNYKFYNTLTNEMFNGQRFDFCKKYNLHVGNVCWMIKGKHKSVKGWILIKK